MGIVIDASILIHAERGRLDINRAVKGREEEEFFLSVITVSELLHGVWRAKEASVRSKRSAFVEGILERFSILPITTPIARIHSQLWADLEGKGKPIGPHDSWIAATCLAYGHTLVTQDLKDFKKVPGLVLENWSS